MPDRITPDHERHLRAIVCAAANVCNGDREAMLVALMGAIIVTANSMPDSDAAIEAAIAGLEDGRRCIHRALATGDTDCSCHPEPAPS